MSATILDLLAEAASADPDVPALVFEDGVSITRSELRDHVEAFGGWLAQSIAPGDRVAIMLENRVEFMIAWFAVAAAGGILVSINNRSREHDALHVLRDSGAVVAIAGQAQYALLESLRARCPALERVVAVGDGEPAGLAHLYNGERLAIEGAGADPHAVTNVYYTSGTTGPPKGCMVGHDYWLRFVELYRGIYAIGRDDRLLCCLQFFYGDPPWLLLASLDAGTTLVAMRRFSVSRFWDVVRRHRVTALFALASIPSLLLKAPPAREDREHAVRFALQIGIPASLHATLEERWGFPWMEGYGMTETGLVIAMPPADAPAMVGSGSIGRPCPGVEIRVVDAAGDDVPEGARGELLVRAPGIMRGYLGRPDGTAEVLRDGWVHTGDFARTDERGFVYFLGRSKDIVRRSGENISTAEVEEVLRGHPQVLEVAVLPIPDELRGEEVKAHVLLVDGVTDADVTPEALITHCEQRLARHKVPRFIEYRARPFPTTASMRVKKAVLREEDDDPRRAAWDRERALGW